MRSGAGQSVIGEFLAQFCFQHLARGAQRDGIDKDHIVGDLPLGGFTLVKRQQLFPVDIEAGFFDHHHNRPLIPFGVAHADAGGHGHGRMRHGDVFNVDRADPLAAGLDDVFAAVCDLHETIGIDGGHVAGRR